MTLIYIQCIFHTNVLILTPIYNSNALGLVLSTFIQWLKSQIEYFRCYNLQINFTESSGSCMPQKLSQLSQHHYRCIIRQQYGKRIGRSLEGNMNLHPCNIVSQRPSQTTTYHYRYRVLEQTSFRIFDNVVELSNNMF